MRRVGRIGATVVVAALVVLTSACGVTKPATGASSLLPIVSSTAAVTRPPTSPPPTSPPPAPDSTPPPKETEAPVAAAPQEDNGPYGQPFGLAFPTTSRGALVAMWCEPLPGVCRVYTKTTADGGRSWSGPHAIESVSRPADVSGLRPWDLGVSHLAFTSATDGFAYGPQLFATHDGGTTWTRIDTPDPVLALDATTQPPLLLEGHGCDNSGMWCADTYVSNVEAGRIVRAKTQPPFPATQLTPGDDQVAYAFANDAVAVTRDAGATWAPVRLPKGACVTDFSATDASSLWIVCGNDGAAGTMRKQLWRSDDGGASWRGPKELEYLGYTNHIVAAGKEAAWRFGARAGLFHTTDGGESWHRAISSIYGEGGGAPNGFAVAGPDNAWILDPGGPWSGAFTLTMTRDAGQTWRTVTLVPPVPSVGHRVEAATTAWPAAQDAPDG